ncbi:hypothetical protein JCM3765_002900 [Sporobolomyces pararoseus]
MTEVQASPPPIETSPRIDQDTTPAVENGDSTAEAVDLAPATEPIETEMKDPTEPTTNQEPESVPPPPATEPEPEPEPEQDPAEKKRIQDQLKQESRKRGNRMFGMMLGTLKRAKQQVDTSVESDQMKKRLELEKKLKDKLDGEKKLIQIRNDREREVRDLRMNIQKREEEISSADAIYRVRHDAKYNLAGFLCTSFPLPTPASVTDAISVPFNPRLPHSMHLTTPTNSSSSSSTSSASRPIYYLPYRLLPSQEDRIEDQIDLVKKATKRDQEEWRDLKLGKQKEIRKLRDELEEKLEQLGRLEREERQRKRREAEEREEGERREREKRRRTKEEEKRTEEKDTKMDGVEQEPTGEQNGPTTTNEKSEESTDDLPAMKEDRPNEENGAAEGADSAEQEKEVVAEKMDLAGEEDLEY